MQSEIIQDVTDLTEKKTNWSDFWLGLMVITIGVAAAAGMVRILL